MLSVLKSTRAGREEGFTLIELLVVIVIIGTLASIAVPLFFKQEKEALFAGLKADVRDGVVAVNTALVKDPRAKNTAVNIGPLAQAVAVIPKSSPNNSVTITGSAVIVNGQATTLKFDEISTWDAYAVYGSNSVDLPGYGYVFDSVTGKYYTVTPS